MATTGETRGRPPKVRPQSVNADPTAELKHQRALAQLLTELRTRLGWTPGDLAARAELTPEAVRSLEPGETTPKTWTIKLLVEALRCPVGWLAFRGEIPPRQ